MAAGVVSGLGEGESGVNGVSAHEKVMASGLGWDGAGVVPVGDGEGVPGEGMVPTMLAGPKLDVIGALGVGMGVAIGGDPLADIGVAIGGMVVLAIGP